MAPGEQDRSAMRSQLGRARGLGSAKEGVAHWWAQRVSAIALIPLSLWFASAILCLAGADYTRVEGWLSRPSTLILAVLFLAVLCWHGALGLRVVIEDYVRSHAIRLAALLAMQFTVVILGASGMAALLVIAFGR